MAGWGLQGTCQHILPHEPYVLCHNCQKRFGAVRMVCGCGLARSTRRQECVSFNCTDMPRVKEKKNTGRLSSSVLVTPSWKEMFVYDKRANLWITKPKWQLPVMCKDQFESLLPSTVYSVCNCRQSHLVLTLAAHTVLGKPEFWREAEIWDLLVPARNCQMFTGGCLTVRVGAGQPQFFGLIFFLSLYVSGMIHTQFGNLDPY